MLTFTDRQVLEWITPLIWPFLRILALFSALPLFAQGSVPARVRVALAALIALCAQATLPTMPVVALDSWPALMAVLQQLLIGLSLGFSVRIVFSAVEFAGEIVGLQMGLNFQGFFNPAMGSETTAVSSFFGILVSWLFIAIGGHLALIVAVVQSFQAFPVGPEPFAFLRTVQPQSWGAEIFRLGLWIAMPMIAMLLFVNMVLGIITRVAQQLNVFSIGFPITVSVGMIGLLLSVPTMQTPFTVALEHMLSYFQ
jgi:flagellar biosynthetic protein FliR